MASRSRHRHPTPSAANYRSWPSRSSCPPPPALAATRAAVVARLGRVSRATRSWCVYCVIIRTTTPDNSSNVTTTTPSPQPILYTTPGRTDSNWPMCGCPDRAAASVYISTSATTPTCHLLLRHLHQVSFHSWLITIPNPQHHKHPICPPWKQ